ncbi:germination protein, Ger(x)C family [Natronincola peptidivorans]|uniref:Germination protein, Ger(X)C family n=1 Tax=Natronincola peptidivorans TaxID=426128 RepID=A0A1I0AIS1_9FIRM|nr:Ger(x)C family spore germination protein [Natronincola peptidivorans]SES94186.1 germination protein, Ger(x)C family [Natronincola peptidivorans]
MKRFFIGLSLAITLLLTSCYSYNDINRMLFPIALVIDIDEEGNVLVSQEIFHSFRSQQENAEQGQRILYRRSGKSFLDVISKFEEMGAQPFSYTQNKIIIFTERAAKEGIKDYLDALHRNQDFLLRPYVAVYYGDVVELLNMEIKQNEYLGLYLFDLFDRPVERVTMQHLKLFEVLKKRRMGKNVLVITSITIDKNPLEDKIRKDGAAVFHNDKLVEKITTEEMKPYAFMVDRARAGFLDVPHPHGEDKLLTVQILKGNTVSDILYEDGKVILRQTINVRTSIVGTEASIVLDEETVRKIDASVQNTIKKNCHELFHKYKEKGIDIFDIQEMFHRKYPRLEVENAIEVTEYHLQIDHHIEGTTNVTSFR